MYSEKVMDHFANPRNSGEMENPDGVGTVGNPTCGDLQYDYRNSYWQNIGGSIKN